MIDKLLNVIELFNNSNLWKAEDILRQNEYKKLMKYCKYSKNKKNKMYIYFYLGIAHHYVEKNYEEAKKYYIMAAEKGNPNAILRIRCIEKKIAEKKRDITMSKFKNLCEIEKIKHTITDNFQCQICKGDYKTIINLNCRNKYEHLYCQKCSLKWYKENSLTCLLCMCPIDPDNISLNISYKP